ncbi:putative disease resistance protein At1g50180 [Durio zibethinus]|uniref:Disease resistance protein At1g50180 n=1 Tax=Durio zibethinus TaxID=66656 RepID=A0A6P5YNG4_DURZI|nr:putative disease resistance protein At1g50180 [Durio zibethinus]
MAYSAVSSVAAWIEKVIVEGEQSWNWDPLREVYLLLEELKRMKIFLEDMRQDENTMLTSPYLAEIGELAYEARDVIEALVLKTLPKREQGISNVIKRSACFLREAWMVIQEVTSEIINLERHLRDRSNLDHLEKLRRSHSSSNRHPHFLEDNVVGFDANIMELVSDLVDDKSHFRVVSIWGKGGSGKTTMAKMLHHHSQVRNHFDCFAWAYVSQNCQRRNVWQRILISLNVFDEDDRNKRDEQVAEKLFKFLKEHKCLVILDDIPSIQAWDSIKAALPRNLQETSSKILITCRNQEVALNADPKCYLHELQPLNEDNSLKLFRRIAFPQRQFTGYRSGDEEVEEMVNRCEGLPLAIVVLGGIIATTLSEEESLRLCRILRCGGYGEPSNLLALSYDVLPSYLKPCFLYLSLFPDGYEIPTVKLIQLWVAENIIPFPLVEIENRREIWIEEIAEYYLMELVERRMMQVGQLDASLKIRTCYVHDMIRDMCLAKAREQNFVHIVDTTQVGYPLFSIGRLAIHESGDMRGIDKLRDLRSLFFFDVMFTDELIYRSLHQSNEIYATKDKPWLSTLLLLRRVIRKFQRTWRYLSNNFKLLRVLEFEGSEMYVGGELQSDIGKLIHLRYLSLRKASYVSRLPSTLGKLTLLQTLNLEIDEKFAVHVPDVIWKLKSLRHLYLPKKCNDKTKLKLNDLRNLQTLVNFNTKNCYMGDLCSLTNLRELRISRHFILEDIEEILDSNPRIVTSEHLRSLYIWSQDPIDPKHLMLLLSNCVDILELSLTTAMRELPGYHQFPSKITYLYLNESELDRDPMPTLEKLPNLRVLGLHKAFAGKEIVCSSEGFAQLISLKLIENSNLEEWRVDENAMPKLRNLEIVDCRSLKMLPVGLKLVKTLQEVKMEKMPRAFKDRLVQGGEDFCNFQHISTIIFQNCH